MGEIVHDYDDLTPIEEVVKYKGVKYLLREADAGAATRYRNARTAAYRYEGTKVVGYDNLADTELLLVSLCLYTEDGKKHIHEETIKQWPAPMVTDLYVRAKEISKLTEDMPERTAIAKALALPQSPISLVDLRRYVISVASELEKREYIRLLILLTGEDGDDSKN